MFRLFFFGIGMSIICYQTQAQSDSLVTPGAIITKAKVFYDSDKYDLAIKELKRIDPRDTSYALSLSEIIKSYLDSKQYDEALTACNTGLTITSPYRASFLLSSAKALAAKNDYAQATVVLSKATKEFPFDPALTYRLGVILYDQKKYAEAEDQFFKTIEQSPFYSGAHLYLAQMALLRGQKVMGMFSMGIYVAITEQNKQLIVLENFVKNELSDENTMPKTDNPFERLDEIIRAKISFEDGYKVKIPIDVGVVKQYQLLFEQINEQSYDPSNSWVRLYLPIYKDIVKGNFTEAFMYHLLKTTTIKEVPKWLEKNSKLVQQFYQSMNASMVAPRSVRNVPVEFGYKKPMQCRYYDNGNLNNIGNKDSKDQEIGLWYYFDENGIKLAEGSYLDGKKVGIWNYFNNSGVATDVYNYDSGETRIFDEQGKLNKLYTRKEKKIDGLFKLYYSCGALHEDRLYTMGNRNGPGKTYYPNGKLEAEFTFKNDSLHGRFTKWYENGVRQAEEEFEMGKDHGKYISYFRNGKTKTSGTYAHGIANGIWSYYFENGKLSSKGEYKADNPFGKWEYYDILGQLTESRNYNEKGEYDGDDVFFHDGKRHYQMQWKNDLMIAQTYYDKAGKVLSTAENSQGTFHSKGYFPTGELRVEVNYVKGLREGDWKYYRRSGRLSAINRYKDGKLNGLLQNYYDQGPLKDEFNYSNGELHGAFREYHLNGSLRGQGWYSEGKKEQKWISYFPNNQVMSDVYYINDDAVGPSLGYSPEGKLFSKAEHDAAGKLINYHLYKADGSQISEVKESENQKIITTKYKSGKNSYKTQIGCGEWDGETTMTLSNGKNYSSRLYDNGNQTGKYFIAKTDGTIEGTGSYTNNHASGLWTWYSENGIKHSEGNYSNGDIDSLWTYYYSTGTISSTSYFVEGERHGETPVFGLDRKPVLYKLYDAGDLLSYRTTSKEGKLSDWTPFAGSQRIVTYYPNGILAIDEFYKNGLFDSVRNVYYPTGKLYSVSHYINGQHNGTDIEYYPDGKIRSKRAYTNDQANGVWEYYDQAGQLSRKETYMFENLHGVSEFFTNGRKTGEQNFWVGSPTD